MSNNEKMAARVNPKLFQTALRECEKMKEAFEDLVFELDSYRPSAENYGDLKRQYVAFLKLDKAWRALRNIACLLSKPLNDDVQVTMDKTSFNECSVYEEILPTVNNLIIACEKSYISKNYQSYKNSVFALLEILTIEH